MNILFGGSFDPVHTGHIKLICGVIEKFNPDKITILPSYISLKKGKHFFPGSFRLELLQITTEEISGRYNSNIEVSDLELSRNESLYIYQAVEILKSDTLLLGGDLNYSNWKFFNEIIDKSIRHYIIYPRDNYPEHPRNSKELLLELTQSKISSSEILFRLKSGTSITGLVPANVEDMIKQKFIETLKMNITGTIFDNYSAQTHGCNKQNIK